MIESFGQLMKEIRTTVHLSKKEMATAVDTTPGILDSLEKAGRTSYLYQSVAICHELGIPPSLINLEKEQPICTARDSYNYIYDVKPLKDIREIQTHERARMHRLAEEVLSLFEWEYITHGKEHFLREVLSA